MYLTHLIILMTLLLSGSCKSAGTEEGDSRLNRAQEKRHLQMDTTDGQLRIFLCGDVMTGRGIDQALPHPADPQLHESYIKDARDYLSLAEQENGDIRTPVSFDYIWGKSLSVLDDYHPAFRIINLETSVTKSDDYWEDKGINYRMHPKNAPAITAAGIDVCVLGNNHVLDWGYEGLRETIQTLKVAGIQTTGAGSDAASAAAPAILEKSGHRLLVFSFGTYYSGVPEAWKATGSRPGVNFLPGYAEEGFQQVRSLINRYRREGDLVVFSIHWGGNWGYEIPAEHRRFAHRLIDEAGVHLIHGHSSHHVKGLEIYNGHLILYGCGDFINDYEGISGKESYRGDLSLMYFPELDTKSGKLASLEMVPMQMKRFRLTDPPQKDAAWMFTVLKRESDTGELSFQLHKDGVISLE